MTQPVIHYFNPRSPRGLRPNCHAPKNGTMVISIHAAQEGCDLMAKTADLPARKISIHAAQEGCDPRGLRPRSRLIGGPANRFQSTQPKRAATGGDDGEPQDSGDFNPRSPRGLRQVRLCQRARPAQISIHAAQEGCDIDWKKTNGYTNISIHAAQEGCD